MPHLVGPGLIGAAGPTSVFYTTPFPHKPGDTARDKDGNEYVFCDLKATLYRGCVAAIDSSFKAGPLLGAAAAGFMASRVGVFVGGDATSVNNATSDNGGWFQIYGLHQAVQTNAASGGLSSDGTVAYTPIVQSAVGTPSGVLSLLTVATIGTSIAVTSSDGVQIYGLWVVPNGASDVLTSGYESVSDIQSAVSAWPVSGASGPSSLDPDPGNTAAQGMLTSGTNTSGFIGQTYVCFLNYPYVHGIAQQLPGLAGT